MKYEKKNRKPFIVLFSFAVLLIVPAILFSDSIKLPESMSTYAEIFPRAKWMLIRGEDGELMIDFIHYEQGGIHNYNMIGFERGESISFTFNSSVYNKNNVLQGDTIGTIYSSELSVNLLQLEGELEEKKAELRALISGEKESVISEMENKLRYAQAKVEEQAVLFKRTESLFKKEIISEQEYEEAEWELKQLEIERDICKAQLDNALSGSKPEELSLLRTAIASITEEMNLLKQRLESFTVLSPIDGFISRNYAKDTLITIVDIDKVMLAIPIKTGDRHIFEEGEVISLKFDEPDIQCSGRITGISNEAALIDGASVVSLLTLVDNIQHKLLPNMIVQGSITVDSLSIGDYLVKTVSK